MRHGLENHWFLGTAQLVCLYCSSQATCYPLQTISTESTDVLLLCFLPCSAPVIGYKAVPSGDVGTNAWSVNGKKKAPKTDEAAANALASGRYTFYQVRGIVSCDPCVNTMCICQCLVPMPGPNAQSQCPVPMPGTYTWKHRLLKSAYKAERT
jgi:hypothetical protein